MAVTQVPHAVHRYIGLSSDAKPTSVPTGSTFLTSDTQVMFITHDGTTWVLKDATGEVQASPTSNTLLDRVKALLTGIVLAAGSAIVGRFGHDKTGIGDGRKTVTAAATAEALAGSTTAKVVAITAETDNTGYVVVGGSTVVAALATRRGIPLAAGDSVVLEIDDLADVFLDVTVSGEGATFTYLT